MTGTVDAPKIRIMLDAETISARVLELGQAIDRDFAGHDVVIVAVLKGSLPFYVDLARAITIPVRFDYLAVSSYEGTASTGVVKFVADLSGEIAGRDVILVEDIVDTGRTMAYLLDNLRTRGPKSLHVATLLDKPSRREVEVPLDYVGFEIPDEFVVGYGLDYEQFFRNLPYIGVLEEIPEIP